ncbi:hypothetical protein Tco_1367918 [Tanacetum coccineum]
MEYRVSDDDDLEGFKMQLEISNGKVDTLVITKCKKVTNKSHEMCTPRPRNSPQSEVTSLSKKPSDYVLSSPTLDHMLETPLDVNNAFMHGNQIHLTICLQHQLRRSIRLTHTTREKFDMAMGSPAESFSQLPYYCHNLKLANEGTVTHIETDDEGCFKLLYVGFGVAIRAFLTSMRPLIIIDGAHLKGTYEGMKLLAVGMDDNNQIVPIATGVCQGGESMKAWSFFLSKLKESIDVAADELTEWAAAKVHCRKLKSAKWIVDEVDKCQVYQVNDLRNIKIIDLDSHECTYRKWQLSELPCSHVISTSVYLN